MAKNCGAKTRAGGKCKAPAMANGRCRVHGGKSTGPKDQSGNFNAATHGIYQQFLTDDERDQYNLIRLGEVDHEIRLTRIRLARALKAEADAKGDVELVEVTENDGAGEYVARESRKKRVKDYAQIIDRLTARIESLERTRKTLDNGDGDNDQFGAFETMPYED